MKYTGTPVNTMITPISVSLGAAYRGTHSRNITMAKNVKGIISGNCKKKKKVTVKIRFGDLLSSKVISKVNNNKNPIFNIKLLTDNHVC